MTTVEEVTLWVHVATGFLALAAGAGALATEKGGRRHRRFGRTYVYSMAVVSGTALVLYPLGPGFWRLFLALVAAEQELHHVRLAGLQVVVEVLRRRRVESIHLERRSGPWCSSSPRKFWCAGGGPLWGEAALAGLGKHF